MACGQMDLNIDYFYSLTPRQFYNHQKGWSDRRDAESKERMIFTRRLMYASLAPWSKNLKEQELWPFDFENKALVIDADAMEKELEETRKYWEEIDRRKNADPIANKNVEPLN